MYTISLLLFLFSMGIVLFTISSTTAHTFPQTVRYLFTRKSGTFIIYTAFRTREKWGPTAPTKCWEDTRNHPEPDHIPDWYEDPRNTVLWACPTCVSVKYCVEKHISNPLVGCRPAASPYNGRDAAQLCFMHSDTVLGCVSRPRTPKSRKKLIT